MRFWKQDLTERNRNGKKPIGGIAREGRATWYLRDSFGPKQREKSISWEWHLLTKGVYIAGAYVEVEPGGDYDYSFHVFTGLFGRLHRKLRPTAEPRKKDWHEPRILSLTIHDGRVRWEVWKDPHSWSSTDGWRNSSWDFVAFLFGQTQYSKRILETTTAVIPMPEGTYPAKVELTEDSWKRPRWRTTRIRRATVTPETPIPVPGKGENAWDCGDSCISSQTSRASTVAEAVTNYVNAVLRDRERYGGKSWAPPEAKQA
jgi:hypothetical protein